MISKLIVESREHPGIMNLPTLMSMCRAGKFGVEGAIQQSLLFENVEYKDVLVAWNTLSFKCSHCYISSVTVQKRGEDRLNIIFNTKDMSPEDTIISIRCNKSDNKPPNTEQKKTRGTIFSTNPGFYNSLPYLLVYDRHQ